MSVKSISVSNFKSFESLEIDLNRFNIVVGANASGKSNFVQIFRFLRDISDFGLANAISMQGGGEYLTNRKLGSSEAFSLRIVYDQKLRRTMPKREEVRPHVLVLDVSEITYEFHIGFSKTLRAFEVLDDRILLSCRFWAAASEEREHAQHLADGELVIANKKGTIDIRSSVETVRVDRDEMVPAFIPEEIPPRVLLAQIPYVLTFTPLLDLLEAVSIYDFDPKLSKRAVPFTGKTELEEDGSNLAIVLGNIRRSRSKRRVFLNLMQDLLPFVDGVDTKRLDDKSVLFRLRETFAPGRYFAAPFVSDGTVHVAALITALYLEERAPRPRIPLIIIEEPGRNIHASLMSRIVTLMKEASSEKQIITTTHNPEIVRHADLESLLLIARDRHGFSRISRPSEKKEVRTFLSDEIGMSLNELYIENLLGG